MGNQITHVSGTAIGRLRKLEQELQEIVENCRKYIAGLKDAYADNCSGIGAHSDEILSMVEQMEDTLQNSEKQIVTLAGKLHIAVLIRRRLEQNRLTECNDIARFRGQLYSQYCRKMRSPADKKGEDIVQGTWQGSIFCINPQWVPARSNSGKKTMGEIREDLKETYGFCFEGIPFIDGYADFSAVSVAQIPLTEFAEAYARRYPEMQCEPLEMFQNRAMNMDMADALAAEKQIPIPGLHPGYTGAELRAWRREKGFTWDESPRNGYLLVPRVIHDNISHTGLVAIARKSEKYKAKFSGDVVARCGLSGRMNLRADTMGKVIYKKLHLCR